MTQEIQVESANKMNRFHTFVMTGDKMIKISNTPNIQSQTQKSSPALMHSRSEDPDAVLDNDLNAKFSPFSSLDNIPCQPENDLNSHDQIPMIDSEEEPSAIDNRDSSQSNSLARVPENGCDLKQLEDYHAEDSIIIVPHSDYDISKYLAADEDSIPAHPTAFDQTSTSPPPEDQSEPDPVELEKMNDMLRNLDSKTFRTDASLSLQVQQSIPQQIQEVEDSTLTEPLDGYQTNDYQYGAPPDSSGVKYYTGALGFSNQPFRPRGIPNIDDELQRSLMQAADDSDSESLYHQPIKQVDKPSAERLARRLFNLDGFKKSDVAIHLGKKNEFSILVGEEYLKLFDFSQMRIDNGVRLFLSKFTLVGETQERERVLNHFASRFIQSNPDSDLSGCTSQDSCHTLACAIMLLNTDLHAPNIEKRMSFNDFVSNLSGLNDNIDFPRELLHDIYRSIKEKPIDWAGDEMDSTDNTDQSQLSHSAFNPSAQIMADNPFLEVPDPNRTNEYKHGCLLRKCCIDSTGRKTKLGRRGWKWMYVGLRDLCLYFFKDEQTMRKATVAPTGTGSVVHIHHCLATVATDYKKKAHVFRLYTADWAEYLFQASGSTELKLWIDTINLVAATLSAKPLPAAVGSSKTFQRPLFPSSYTSLGPVEQLQAHRSRVAELEVEIDNHKANPPSHKVKTRALQAYTEKGDYLLFELNRFKVYVSLLQNQLINLSGLNNESRGFADPNQDENDDHSDSGSSDDAEEGTLIVQHNPPKIVASTFNEQILIGNSSNGHSQNAQNSDIILRDRTQLSSVPLADRYSYQVAIKHGSLDSKKS